MHEILLKMPIPFLICLMPSIAMFDASRPDADWHTQQMRLSGTESG